MIFSLGDKIRSRGTGDKFSDVPFPKKCKHAIHIKQSLMKQSHFSPHKIHFESTDLTIAIHATLSFQIELIGCHLANFDRINKQEIGFELTEKLSSHHHTFRIFSLFRTKNIFIIAL